MSLLEVRDLGVTFGGWRGAHPVQAVKHVSFTLDRGETLALVGESGSGKSVTALSVLQLLPYPHAKHPNGSVRFKGEELIGAPERRLRGVRGNRIAMPRRPCRSFRSLRICACTVTSSAVVGSSAIRTFGLQASAIATITRWRMPPDN